MINEEVDKRGFIWYSLRISFWLMIVLLLVFLVLFLGVINASLSKTIVVSLVYSLPILAIFNGIVSITSISKYERKSFVIISLISSFLVIIGFIIFLLSRRIVY